MHSNLGPVLVVITVVLAASSIATICTLKCMRFYKVESYPALLAISVIVSLVIAPVVLWLCNAAEFSNWFVWALMSSFAFCGAVVTDLGIKANQEPSQHH